jgi:hypothetical protein
MQRHFTQATLEEPTLAVVAAERQGATVARGGVGEATGAPVEVGARGGEEMVVLELAALLESVDLREPLLGALGHRDRDRAVQLDDG